MCVDNGEVRRQLYGESRVEANGLEGDERDG
jgi:hypothetical protein